MVRIFHFGIITVRTLNYCLLTSIILILKHVPLMWLLLSVIFFKDNQVVGVKLGYKHTDGHLGNVSFKIDDDVNFTLKELKFERRVV